MTIIFLATFLFFGFFADSAYAANPNERCLELVSEAKSEPKTNFEVWTCIDNSDESQKKLSEKIEAGGLEVIVALDVTRLNLSNQDFLKLSKSESFDLIIDGICAGKCSRILLPLARQTTFSSGSFAILDKSSIEGLTVKGAKQMKAIRLLGGPAAAVDLRDVNEKYIEEFKNQFLPELEIIVNSKVNATHLLWHNFISRTSKRSKHSCGRNKNIVVFLTISYMRENLMYVPDKNKKMYNSLDMEKVYAEVKKVFGNEVLLYEPYSLEPLFPCSPVFK